MLAQLSGLQAHNIVCFHLQFLYRLYILILKFSQNTEFLLVSGLEFRIWTAACNILGVLMYYFPTVQLNTRIPKLDFL